MSQKNDGFFKNFHDTINKTLDMTVTNNFVNLETNAKRVWYLCSLPVVKNYDLTDDLGNCENSATFYEKKDLEKARGLKAEGNNAVQKGDWISALKLYSQSLLFMPNKEGNFLYIFNFI